MIKKIFLPEKTKNRRLISQRVVGIAIQEDMIRATQVYATPSTTFIEQFCEEHIPPGAPTRQAERTSETVSKIMAKFSKYDQIRIAISDAIVTFKELTLPFTDLEKIKMVIEYEVEPLLPFSINEAVIDFIITKKFSDQQSSQVLVAAVRTQDLQTIFDIYQNAGVDPSCITVDLFALYGLYLQIPEYQTLAPASALVDIGTTSSSVAFLLNGELRLIRNIGKGITTIAQHISEETNLSLAQVLQRLIDSGIQHVDDEKYNQVAQKYIIHFLNDIQFTLNSFSLKLNYYKEISKILLVGKGTDIKGLVDFTSTMLQIPCEYFSCNKLFKTKIFKNKTKQIPSNWTQYAIALGAALPYQGHDEFNLRKKSFVPTSYPLANKQLMVAGLLIILIFTTLGIRGFFQVKTLSMLASQKENESITKIKTVFPVGASSLKKNKLAPLIKDAEQELVRRQEAWAPFLQENLQPLEVLHDLTQTMDRRLFNITIKKIALSIEEFGMPVVEVHGLFKSKPGEHFKDFANFVKSFEKQSKMLSFKEKPTEDLTEDGVEFTFKLKIQEKSEE